MSGPIKILLQTTIPFTADDWHIGRFSLLRDHLSRAVDDNGHPLFSVTNYIAERKSLGKTLRIALTQHIRLRTKTPRSSYRTSEASEPIPRRNLQSRSNAQRLVKDRYVLRPDELEEIPAECVFRQGCERRVVRDAGACNFERYIDDT